MNKSDNQAAAFKPKETPSCKAVKDCYTLGS
jgi:hypothetical protein